LLYRSERTVVHRRSVAGDRSGVIVKEMLGPSGQTRTAHEAGILRRLAAVAGVPRLLDGGSACTLVLRDCGRRTLTDLISDGPRPPQQVLALMRDLAEVLAAIHRAGVLHRDLNPYNVVVDDDLRPSLVDFDLATVPGQDRPEGSDDDVVLGRLPYLAPEQTGRTGRSVDQRSDLYGLAATAYALATGRPPFGEGDPVALVREILVEPPAPLLERVPGIPFALSAIVARLLDKDPDRRYHSAQGLLLDLRRVSTDPQGQIELGRWDFPAHLSPPARLVGREEHLSRLKQALDTVVRGRSAAVLVSGEPGVGKSVLVEQLRPLVAAHGGWFLSGKADQFGHDAGSNVFAEAATAAGKLLLGLPGPQLDPLRERLVRALGTNAGLVTAVLPTFEHLLQVPPEIADGDPVENGRRLLAAVPELFRVIADRDRPVVILLDDLQWAGTNALNVIDIMLAEGVPGVLLIGGYRSTEVDAAHPLTAMMRRWEMLGVAPEPIRLRPLTDEDVTSLLGQMLRLDDVAAGRLASAVTARSRGNPYDTVELVNALYSDGILLLGENGWYWKDAEIRHFVGSNDVIEMLQSRVTRLPEASREALEVMACLGGTVRSDLLAIACSTDVDTLAERLRPAVEDGLLVDSGSLGPDQADAGGTLRFRHDRVQQAAHDLLDDVTRVGLQLGIARRLMAGGLDAEAATQYLAVHELVSERGESERVVELLRAAARRARLISNYAWVEKYVRVARDMRSALSGDGRDAASVDLDVELHGALYALARPQEADEVFERIRSHTDDPLELASAACVQISSLTNRGHIPQALALGLGLIARLGIDPPGDDLLAAVRAGFAQMRVWLESTTLGDDLARPEATDPAALAAARLIAQMCPPAFFSDHVLLGWLVTRAQALWADQGPQGHLIPALAHTNSFELGCVPDHDLDRATVERVLAVGEAREEEIPTSHGHFLHAILIGHWHQPLEVVVAEARQAREGLLRGGDLQTACFAFYPSVIGLTDSGLTLDELVQEVDDALALAARTGNDQAAETFLAFRQLARALRGRTRSLGSFTDDTFDEGRHIAACAPANPLALVYFHLESAICAAVLDQGQELTAHLEALRPIMAVVGGTYSTGLVRFLNGLDLAKRIRAASGTDVAALLGEFDAHHTFIHGSAAGAPHNFRHLDLWLDAERAWAQGDLARADDAFDLALVAADGANRPWHEALLAEHAGSFHAERGHHHHATLLLAQARQGFRAWGATAKVEQLDLRYPAIRSHVVAASGPADAPAIPHSTSVTDDTIDALAILRASQALAGQQDLDQLREAITVQLQALTAATGVQLVLFDAETGQWRLPPDAVNTSWRSVQDTISDELPLTAFRYAERTAEPLLVPDAVTDSRFAADPYLRGLAHCALMLIPIGGQERRRAMLVLENRLSRGVFTPARLDAVTLLAGQLAISLENALAERFRALVQRAFEATIVVGRDGIVTYASRPTAALVGLDRDDLLGSPVLDVFHPDDRCELESRLVDVDPSPASGEVSGAGTALTASTTWQARVRHTDDDPCWVEVTITDLRDDPAVAGIVLRLHDVTARRRLENELRHAQKMESVGQLAAGVAHEINTPIQFISDNLRFIDETAHSFSRLIQAYRNPGDADPAQVAVDIDVDFLLDDLPDALHQTRDGVDRVARIVRAMKASVHPGTEAKTVTDLNEVVRNTLVISNSQVKYVADVDLDLDDDLPQVSCYPGDIGQVLLNLIVNAAQAIQDTLTAGRTRGTIRIRSRHVGPDVVFEIHDDGAGIPAEIADRVFEQFFTTKPVGSGTGQGLALAYFLVRDRHDGTITFTSAPGQGTTFTVTIPVSPSVEPVPVG
jgi:PAS domain S-box-containing protein